MTKKALSAFSNARSPQEIAERLARRGTVQGPLASSKPTLSNPRRDPAGHKFRAGETVTLVPNRYGSNRHGRFEVTRLLPEEQGMAYYRLKSVTDGHERVAREDELAL